MKFAISTILAFAALAMAMPNPVANAGANEVEVRQPAAEPILVVEATDEQKREWKDKKRVKRALLAKRSCYDYACDEDDDCLELEEMGCHVCRVYQIGTPMFPTLISRCSAA